MAKKKSIKSLQRRLIPINIIVIILSLVAAISLFFAPLLTIDVGEMMSAMQEEMGNNTDSTDVVSDEMMSEMFANISDLKITITTSGVLKFASMDDPMSLVKDFVADMISKYADEMLANVALQVIRDEVDFDKDNAEINEAIDNIDIDVLLEKFQALENATEATKEEIVADFVDELVAQLEKTLGEGEVGAEATANINEVVLDLYDSTVEGASDGKFSTEACICVNVSKMLAEDEENPVIYDNYVDLVDALLKNSGEGSSALSELSEALDVITDAAMYLGYVLLFFVGVWVLLALFALLHLFLKNKRFMMWYVKLFGGIPCLLFYVLPTQFASVLSSGMAGAEAVEGMAAMAAVLAGVSSMAWISGVCYLLLWFVSIFLAFPIKHKIRKLKKQGYAYDEIPDGSSRGRR